MADHEIKFNTALDPSGLKDGLDKALSHAESEVMRSAAKQTAAIQKAAGEEKEIIRKTEKANIAERKKALKEQIEAIKARPDLTEPEKQRETEAVKEAEQAKIDAINASLKQQIALVQAAADEKIKSVRDGARQQMRELQQGNRGNLRSIEDFAGGASRQLGGFMKTAAKALKSPVALGAAVVLAGRQVKQFLNSTAAAWRVEEQAQIALAAAARNNPYLNDRGVHQLRQFANEMQRLTGIDNVQVMGAQTRLAALGRNQQEIEQIVRTAADIAATGLMSYDQAVDELSQSFSGFTRRLERMFPELKNLTEEAKMAGDAVGLIAQSVSGMAEQAMQSGTGSVQAFGNAVESLRRSIGRDWERAVGGFRRAMANFINSAVEAREGARELREAIREWEAEPGSLDAMVRAYDAILRDMHERRRALETELMMSFGDVSGFAHVGVQNRISQLDREIEARERELESLRQIQGAKL